MDGWVWISVPLAWYRTAGGRKYGVHHARYDEKVTGFGGLRHGSLDSVFVDQITWSIV